eukprot:1288159-Pyramimonas_sp.AAC.1
MTSSPGRARSTLTTGPSTEGPGRADRARSWRARAVACRRFASSSVRSSLRSRGRPGAAGPALALSGARQGAWRRGPC